MAATAVRGALDNVAANLDGIRDPEFSARARSEMRALLGRIVETPAAAGR